MASTPIRSRHGDFFRRGMGQLASLAASAAATWRRYRVPLQRSFPRRYARAVSDDVEDPYRGRDEVVYCEVCELPHRRGVLRCEACEHELGTAPNWDAIRAQLAGVKRKALFGVFVLAGFMAGNSIAWGGGGYLIAVGPIAWTVWYGYQYRLISGRLRLADSRRG
jgi:hypothetical protein